MRIPRDEAEDIVDREDGDYFRIDETQYRKVTDQFLEATRWGARYVSVIEKFGMGFKVLGFDGVVYEMGSGDSEYDMFNDQDEVDVVPLYVTTVTRYTP